MDEGDRIAMLIPYYGKWPDWMSYTLRSFAFNPRIHYFLITDLEDPGYLPPNVEKHHSGLEDFLQRVRTNLDILPHIRHPFKLTDFKPALGIIYPDLINGFSHWGYSDLDLIMGDLSSFVSSATMDDSDVISPSRKFFPGHFMLFRNHEKLTHLFKNSDNWKSVFKDPRCFCFDEYLFEKGLDTGVTALEEFTEMRIQSHLKSMRMRKKLLTNAPHRLGGIIRSLTGKRKLQDFNSVLSAAAGKLSVYRSASYLDDVMLLEDGRRRASIRWNRGKLFFGKRELLYYHFQLSKTKDRLVFERLSEDEFILKINL